MAHIHTSVALFNSLVGHTLSHCGTLQQAVLFLRIQWDDPSLAYRWSALWAWLWLKTHSSTMELLLLHRGQMKDHEYVQKLMFTHTRTLLFQLLNTSQLLTDLFSAQTFSHFLCLLLSSTLLHVFFLCFLKHS